MNNLVQFLRDRYDEDEQTARAVEDGSAPWDGQWVADGPNAVRTKNGNVLAYGHQTTDGRNLPMPLKPGLTEHIARHDPARVLREVDAKRQIISDYEKAAFSLAAAGQSGPAYDLMAGATNTLARTLRLLALPYTNHPDYQETWTP